MATITGGTSSSAQVDALFNNRSCELYMSLLTTADLDVGNGNRVAPKPKFLFGHYDTYEVEEGVEEELRITISNESYCGCNYVRGPSISYLSSQIHAKCIRKDNCHWTRRLSLFRSGKFVKQGLEYKACDPLKARVLIPCSITHVDDLKIDPIDHVVIKIGTSSSIWDDKHYFYGHHSMSDAWKIWTTDVLRLCEGRLKAVGLYDAIIATEYGIKYDNAVIKAIVESFHPDSNTFFLSNGELGFALHDIQEVTGLPVSGELYEEYLPTNDKISLLNPFERKVLWSLTDFFESISKKNENKVSYATWVKNLGPQQNDKGRWNADYWSWKDKGRWNTSYWSWKDNRLITACYLVAWLSCVVFPTSEDVIRFEVIFPACRLACGTPLALAPSMVAYLCHSLGECVERLKQNHLINVAAPWHYLYAFFIFHCPALHGKVKHSDYNLPFMTHLHKTRPNSFDLGNARSILWNYANVIFNKNKANSTRREDLIHDGEDISAEDFMWLQCIRPSHLVYRSNSTIMIEPYFPSRFAQQFGYAQGLVGTPRSLKREGSYVEAALAWQDYSSKNTRCHFYYPSVHEEASTTEQFCHWYSNALHSVLELVTHKDFKNYSQEVITKKEGTQNDEKSSHKKWHNEGESSRKKSGDGETTIKKENDGESLQRRLPGPTLHPMIKHLDFLKKKKRKEGEGESSKKCDKEFPLTRKRIHLELQDKEESSHKEYDVDDATTQTEENSEKLNPGRDDLDFAAKQTQTGDLNGNQLEELSASELGITSIIHELPSSIEIPQTGITPIILEPSSVEVLQNNIMTQPAQGLMITTLSKGYLVTGSLPSSPQMMIGSSPAPPQIDRPFGEEAIISNECVPKINLSHLISSTVVAPPILDVSFEALPTIGTDSDIATNSDKSSNSILNLEGKSFPEEISICDYLRKRSSLLDSNVVYSSFRERAMKSAIRNFQHFLEDLAEMPVEDRWKEGFTVQERVRELKMHGFDTSVIYADLCGLLDESLHHNEDMLKGAEHHIKRQLKAAQKRWEDDDENILSQIEDYKNYLQECKKNTHFAISRLESVTHKMAELRRQIQEAEEQEKQCRCEVEKLAQEKEELTQGLNQAFKDQRRNDERWKHEKFELESILTNGKAATAYDRQYFVENHQAINQSLAQLTKKSLAQLNEQIVTLVKPKELS